MSFEGRLLGKVRNALREKGSEILSQSIFIPDPSFLDLNVMNSCPREENVCFLGCLLLVDTLAQYEQINVYQFSDIFSLSVG